MLASELIKELSTNIAKYGDWQVITYDGEISKVLPVDCEFENINRPQDIDAFYLDASY